MISKQTVKSALVAPLLPILIYCLIDFDLSTLDASVSMFFIYALVGLSYAYGLGFLIGLPIIFTLQKTGYYHKITVILVGTILASFIEIYPESKRIIRNITEENGSTFSLYAQRCQIIVDNVRTACGWNILLKRLLTYVLLGGLTGYIFWKLQSKNQ